MTNERVQGSISIAVASYDLLEINVYKRYLEAQSPCIKCSGCRSGMRLLDELRDGVECDAIVLCGQLEDMDGQEFIECLRRLERKPPLLLFDDACRGKCAVSCLRADGTNYMIKRSDLKDLMRELCNMSGGNLLRVDSLCGGLYAAWGISRLSANCAYLTSAVRIACAANERLALRKELFNQVSREHSTTVAAVDCGIRRLIDELEERQAEGWLSFKRGGGLEGKKPTAGQLIYAAKDYLLAHGLT